MDVLIPALMGFFGVATIPGLLGAVVALGAAVFAIYKVVTKAAKKYRTIAEKANNLYDSIVGSDAIIDPETGKVLRPAKPSLGTRVATIEDWQSETAHALKTLAENQETVVMVKEQMANILQSLETRDAQGQAIVDEWTKWRESFEHAKENAHAEIWETLRSIEKRLPNNPE